MGWVSAVTAPAAGMRVKPVTAHTTANRPAAVLAVIAAILVTVGYRPFPPSIWGKLTTTFEILLVLVVIVSQLSSAHWLRVAKHWGAFVVVFFAMFSGLNYAVAVSRRLHAGG